MPLFSILGCTVFLVVWIVWRPTPGTILMVLPGALSLSLMALYLGALVRDRKAREDLRGLIVGVGVIVLLFSAFVELVTRLLSSK